MTSSSSSKGEKFMKKAEREKCWAARDTFWQCYRMKEEDGSKCCAGPRKLFEKECPPTWVAHFDRKYHFEKYKVLLKEDGFREAADEQFVKDKQG